jgi:hypothetical protein
MCQSMLPLVDVNPSISDPTPLDLGLSGDCTEPSVPPSLSTYLHYIMYTFVLSVAVA